MATESSVMAVIRASRPSFRNPHDKIAFAIHATFMAAGHSLIATGKTAFSDQPPSDGLEVGVEGWNELEDSYGFVYSKSHQGKKMNLLVKCLAVDDALMVDTVDLGEPQKEPLHLQINLKDYVSEDSNGVTNYGEAYKNFKGLVKVIDDGILAKAEPKVETSSSSGISGGDYKFISSDEHSVDHQPHPSMFYGHGNNIINHEGFTPLCCLAYPPVFPSSQGDLHPSPGAGVFPFGGSNIGGDMLVGPNDPRWFGLGQPTPSGGRIPGFPPGARFDPIGPPDVPGFEPRRFVRGPPRPRRQPHPDLEPFGDPDYI